MSWHALASVGTFYGLTSVSPMVPEARGDNKFLTLSISRGTGKGGGRREQIQELRRPRPGFRCIYTANGPRVRVSEHLTYY